MGAWRNWVLLHWTQEVRMYGPNPLRSVTSVIFATYLKLLVSASRTAWKPENCSDGVLNPRPVRCMRPVTVSSIQFSSAQFFIVSVLHQQPEGQLQMQHKRRTK
jgi:hypothetical protein